MNKYLLCVLLCAALFGCAQQEQVKIGGILPLSGDLAQFGNDVQDGMELFAQEHPVELVYEDDGFEASKSLTAYQKLRNINNVELFVGPIGPSSANTIYGAQRGEDVLAMIITYCTDDYAHRSTMICIFPSLDQQVERAFTFLQEQGLEQGYVVYDGSQAGLDIQEASQRHAPELGMEIVGSDQVDLQQQSFGTVATKIKASDSAFVYIGIPPPANVQLVQELRDQQVDVPLFFSHDIDGQQLRQFSEVLEGSYALGMHENFTTTAFNSKFAAAYNHTPNHYNAYGYEFTAALYHAAKDGEVSKQEVMQQITNRDFAIRNMHYRDHNAVIPFQVTRYVEGSKQRIS